jgi:hypothetical protein
VKKKSIPVYSKSTISNVDVTAGIIKNVVILQAGEDKQGDNFDVMSLTQLAELGNAQGQGVKSRFGHPNACSDALGTYIGRYKNFSVTTNADNKAVVIADLHLDEIAKTSPTKGNIYQYTLDMAQTNPDMFGNSIVYNPDKPELVAKTDSNGNEVMVAYERFQSFIASDVVDSPAATTNLFKSETDFASIATDFLDENPQIFDLLYKNESVVSEFLNKYNQHKKRVSEMTAKKSFTERIKDAVMGVVNEFNTPVSENETKKSPIVAITDAGQEIMIMDSNDNGVPEVGDSVTDANGNPMASQTIKINDGSVITTDDMGVITAIEVPQPQAPVAQSVIDGYEKSVSALRDEISQLKSTYEAEMEGAIAEITKLQNTLAQVKSTGTIPVGQQTFKSTPAKEKNAVELARERMSNKSNNK